MCGIYGFIGIPDASTRQRVINLGILNVERGNKSTGIAVIRHGKAVIEKDILPSYQFFMQQKTAQVMRLLNYETPVIAMGHTRLPSYGANTIDNAHPFEQDGIVFCHNGHIWNFNQLQTEYKTDYGVDTQIIGHLLKKIGIRATAKKLTGTYAVPFVDETEQNVLHFLVNGSPLVLAIGKHQIYFSSQQDHLELAMRGLRMKLRDVEDERHVTISLHGDLLETTTETLPKEDIYQFARQTTRALVNKVSGVKKRMNPMFPLNGITVPVLKAPVDDSLISFLQYKTALYERAYN